MNMFAFKRNKMTSYAVQEVREQAMLCCMGQGIPDPVYLNMVKQREK